MDLKNQIFFFLAESENHAVFQILNEKEVTDSAIYFQFCNYIFSEFCHGHCIQYPWLCQSIVYTLLSKYNVKNGLMDSYEKIICSILKLQLASASVGFGGNILFFSYIHR